MTEIAFHFGAPDKLAYTCRLLRKAVASGASVVVLSDAPAQLQLNAQIWSLGPTDFVAHCVAGASDLMRELSPVLLETSLNTPGLSRKVLVNLLDTVPQGFARFDRLIEVVSIDAQDRELARLRWKHYSKAGYQMVRHDLSGQRADA